MTIKPGAPLAEADLLGADQLRTARLLSLTTVDELHDFLRIFPDDAQRILGITNVADTGNRAGALSTGSSVADIDDTRRDLLQVTQGLGALAPAADLAGVSAELIPAELDRTAPAGEQTDAAKVLLDGFGPVRQQGARGTCVAHAVCAICEFTLGPGVAGFDLSEQFLYWQCKMRDGSPNSSGTWIRIAVPQALQFGVCKETTWPYNAAQVVPESQGPPPDGAKEDALVNRASAGTAMDPGWIETLCAELDTGRPVALSVPLFPNRILAQNTGDFPMPLPGAVAVGGHAMCAVGYGYDNDFLGGGYFVLRNSWGDTWGAQSPFGSGHGTLPFAYMRNFGWEAWSIQGPARPAA